MPRVIPISFVLSAWAAKSTPAPICWVFGNNAKIVKIYALDIARFWRLLSKSYCIGIFVKNVNFGNFLVLNLFLVHEKRYSDN